MKSHLHSNPSRLLAIAAATAAAHLGIFIPAPAMFTADAQVSGRPVPAIENDVDTMMQNYMQQNSIEAGLLGIMQDGRIVYLKGFGVDFDGNDLPENALTRIASCTKPVTAAAIRRLIENETIDLNDNVFDLGQAGGGILNYTPWPSLGDTRLRQVTVDHCLRHFGGWDQSVAGVPDWTYRERVIANNMGIASPPGRISTMRFILGRPLQNNPGSTYAYANTGYLALGLIVEQESGQSLVNYIRNNIITPNMWIPSTEIIRGRTFRAWQNPREPYYDDPTMVTNVYDNFGDPQVERPYGGWDHDARIGQGGLVVSVPVMLEFAQRYRVGIDANIGQPLDVVPLTGGLSHNGAMPGGTTSTIRQRTDGINVFVAFNKRGSSGLNYAANFYTGLLRPWLNSNAFNIPTTSDGFWTRPSGANGGVGGYHRPFGNFAFAIQNTTRGSKIRLRPGSSNFTGVIDRKYLIDAPLGPAVIGQQ